jgi:hypothetical protein
VGLYDSPIFGAGQTREHNGFRRLVTDLVLVFELSEQAFDLNIGWESYESRGVVDPIWGLR